MADELARHRPASRSSTRTPLRDIVQPQSEPSIGCGPHDGIPRRKRQRYAAASISAVELADRAGPGCDASACRARRRRADARIYPKRRKTRMTHITALRILSENQTMPLDAATRRNLELTEGAAQPYYARNACCGCWIKPPQPWAAACCAAGSSSRCCQPCRHRTAPRCRDPRCMTDHVLSERLYDILRNVYDVERILLQAVSPTRRSTPATAWRCCARSSRCRRSQALLAADACAPVCAAL